MKKIGKNTKLYLIGMIIGGITLGITTVIADTIINSTSVAYKTTTVKAAIDELYGLADLKPRVEAIEGYFKNSPGSYFDGNLLELGKNSSGSGIINFYKDGTITGQVFAQLGDRNGIVIGGYKREGVYGEVRIAGENVLVNERNVNELSKITCTTTNVTLSGYSSASLPIPSGACLIGAYSDYRYAIAVQGNGIRAYTGTISNELKFLAEGTVIPVTYCYVTPWQ